MMFGHGHGGGARGRHGSGGPGVTADPGGTGASYPNKPSTITTLRYSLNTVDPNTPVAGTNQGTPLPQTNLDVSDGGLRTTWPSGMTQGTDFMTPFDMARNDAGAYQSAYMLYRFYLPDPTFTGQQVQTKLWYDRYGDRASGNQGFMSLYNGGQSGNNNSRVTFQLMEQRSQNITGGSIPLYSNVTMPAHAFWIHTQQEHVIEMYVDMGSVDSHDAICRVWIDGVLYMDYSPTSPYFWPDPNQWSGYGGFVSPTNKGTATWTGTWINSNGSSNIKALDSAETFTTGHYGIHYAQIWGGGGGTPAQKQQTDHSVCRQFDYFVGPPLP